MLNRLIRVVVLFALVFAIAALAAEGNRDIQQAANGFYKTYLKVQPSGVPKENEQQQFRPYITDSLSRLLKQADQAERRYARVTKGEAPPLLEGDLFTSLFEGAAAFRVLSCDAKASAGSCWVELTYVDPGDRSSFKWKDKAHLVKGARGWLVDDIEFLGDWQFMHKGHLKDLLTRVIKESRP